MRNQITCSNCGNFLELNRIYKERYCLKCHAAYQRINRLKHSELSPEQKKKANCRSYANVYERRGVLVPQPCEYCGDTKVQKHHEDYDKPLDVKWLCKPCHIDLHQQRKLEENSKELGTRK